MLGLDTIKRLIWGPLEKDKVREWATKKMNSEAQHAVFMEKMKHTPSFARCAIENAPRKKKKLPKSQKQKAQIMSYAQAAAGGSTASPTPVIPPREYSLRSKMIKDNSTEI